MNRELLKNFIKKNKPQEFAEHLLEDVVGLSPATYLNIIEIRNTLQSLQDYTSHDPESGAHERRLNNALQPTTLGKLIDKKMQELEKKLKSEDPRHVISHEVAKEEIRAELALWKEIRTGDMDRIRQAHREYVLAAAVKKYASELEFDADVSLQGVLDEINLYLKETQKITSADIFNDALLLPLINEISSTAILKLLEKAKENGGLDRLESPENRLGKSFLTALRKLENKNISDEDKEAYEGIVAFFVENNLVKKAPGSHAQFVVSAINAGNFELAEKLLNGDVELFLHAYKDDPKLKKDPALRSAQVLRAIIENKGDLSVEQRKLLLEKVLIKRKEGGEYYKDSVAYRNYVRKVQPGMLKRLLVSDKPDDRMLAKEMVKVMERKYGYEKRCIAYVIGAAEEVARKTSSSSVEALLSGLEKIDELAVLVNESQLEQSKQTLSRMEKAKAEIFLQLIPRITITNMLSIDKESTEAWQTFSLWAVTLNNPQEILGWTVYDVESSTDSSIISQLVKTRNFAFLKMLYDQAKISFDEPCYQQGKEPEKTLRQLLKAEYKQMQKEAKRAKNKIKPDQDLAYLMNQMGEAPVTTNRFKGVKERAGKIKGGLAKMREKLGRKLEDLRQRRKGTNAEEDVVEKKKDTVPEGVEERLSKLSSEEVKKAFNNVKVLSPKEEKEHEGEVLDPEYVKVADKETEPTKKSSKRVRAPAMTNKEKRRRLIEDISELSNKLGDAFDAEEYSHTPLKELQKLKKGLKAAYKLMETLEDAPQNNGPIVEALPLPPKKGGEMIRL